MQAIDKFLLNVDWKTLWIESFFLSVFPWFIDSSKFAYIKKINLSKKIINYNINDIISKNGAVILIDKNKIIQNSNIISKKLKNVTITPVIKSEGYGIGSELLVKILYDYVN